jgi:preprotein translocase SecE subunit
VEEVKKYIDLAYLLTALLFAWLGVQFVEMIWGWISLPDPDIALGLSLSSLIGLAGGFGLTAYLRFTPKIYTWVTECGVELRKTIWPGWVQTKTNTIVVIVWTFIMGFVLFVFDAVWQRVTGLIY